MQPAHELPTQPSLADILRRARRQAQAGLLTQIASHPAPGSRDGAGDVIRVFRQYVSAEIEATDGDLDRRLGQQLTPALALAMRVLSEGGEKRDSAGFSLTASPGQDDAKLAEGLDRWLAQTQDAQQELRRQIDRLPSVTTYEAASDVLASFDRFLTSAFGPETGRRLLA